MEIVASQLYGDKTHVALQTPLNAQWQKHLLQTARQYFESLDVEGAECELARVSGRGVLNILPNRALVVSAELGDYGFQGVVSVSRYGPGSVLSLYKLLLADEPFAVNHNVEVRRRSMINILQRVDLVDHFFLLDRAMDAVHEFVVSALKEAIEAVE